MMTFGMPNFRLEKDVVNAEIDVVRELGVEIKCGVEVGKDVTIQQLRDEGYKGFYVAIGAQGGRKLGVVGEDSEGVVSGIDFLRDVAFERMPKLSGNVIVVGGGNVAVDVARTAIRYGADKVTMLCLESRDEMPAADDEVLEAEEESIVVECGWGPKEIVAKNGKVTSVIFKKCTSVFDADHRFSPKYDENDTMTLDADFVLAAIGQSIQWVGGDVYTGPNFAIRAIAAGKEGAESVHRYVWEGHSLTLGRVRRDNYHYIDKDNMVVSSYDRGIRQVPGKDPEKVKSFSDERLTFTEEQVKAETSRCLSCGAALVDQKICIGCGLCTTRCEFDAIHLSKLPDEDCAEGVVYEKIIPKVIQEEAKKVKRLAIKKIRA